MKNIRFRTATALLVLAAVAATLPFARAQDAPASAPAVVRKVTPNGTLVTVHADGDPIREPLAQLLEQSGIRVQPSGGPSAGDATVTYAATDKPVMEVIKGLYDATGATGPISFAVGNKSRSEMSVTGRLSAKGPILCVAEELSHVADYRRPDGHEESFLLKTVVVVDPALRPVLFPSQVAAGIGGQAVDDQGHSLTPPATEENLKSADGNGRFYNEIWAAPVDIILSRPPEAGATIKTLTGKFPIWVADKIETFELKGESEQSKVLDGVKATISLTHTAAATGDTWNLSYHFDRPTGMTDDQWTARDKILASSRMWIESRDGTRWVSNSSGGMYGSSVRELTRRFNPYAENDFNRQKAQLELSRAVVEVVVSTKRVDAEYSFENLPLP